VAPSQLCGSLGRSVLLFEASHHRAMEVQGAFARNCPTWQVVVVAKPEEAIRQLDGQTYGAVILDLDPPVPDDLDLLRRIATTGCGIPIMVLAGPDDEKGRHAAGIGSSVVCFFQSLAALLDLQSTRLEQVRLQDDILNRERELGTLDALAEAAGRAGGAEEVLRSALEAATNAIPNVDVAIAQVMDWEKGRLLVREPADASSGSPARQGEPQHKDAPSSPPLDSAAWQISEDGCCPELGPDLRSSVTAPLVIRGKTVGGLSLGSAQADSFDETHQAVLTTLARQAAAALQNVDLRCQLETALQEYQLLAETVSDAVCVVDLEDWRVVEANDQAGELTGCGLEGLLSETADRIYCVQGDRPERVTLRDVLATGESGFDQLSLERRDGRLVPVCVRVNRLMRGDVALAQVVIRDVSATREMEQRLIDTEKLAALGRLTASLAHEINNPLQALRSSISLLSNDVHADEKTMRYVSIADREVQRLIQLVRRMLDFYRPAGEERDLVDVNDLLEDTLALASKQIEHSGISVVREFAEALPLVAVQVSYLRQVFINLVLHHVEAMPGGGQLTVGTDVDRANGQVVIIFDDTGEGIPPEELPYVFEPFYWSREGSAGLGLAVSHSIVERHGGSLEVSSEEGAGTRFCVRLPVGG
jgi:two-component system NtrC family sensor kinase